MRAVRSAAGPVVVTVTVLSLGTGSGLVADPVGRQPASASSAQVDARGQDAVRPAEVPPDDLALVAALTTPSAAPAGRVLGPSVTGIAAQGIPQVALDAYRSAATALAVADPGCRLDWSVLAAIGRVESDHGRFGGSHAQPDGVVRPAIIGIALDGRPGVARIGDSDGGRLDGDAVLDRAVGPMQFIPGTWAAFGRDGNGDAVPDPQNVYDAATSAGYYLCAGEDDLSTPQGLRSAVLRYNHSDSYVAMVTTLAAAYAAGTVPLAPGSGGYVPAVVRAGGRDGTGWAATDEEPGGRVAGAGPRQPAQAAPTGTATASPTASRPTAAHPTTEPTTARPTRAQPTTAQPTTTAGPTGSPTTSPSTTPSCPTTTPTGSPTTGQPTTGQPTTGQATTDPTTGPTTTPTTAPGQTGSPTSPAPGTCDAPPTTGGTTPGPATPTATATSS